MSGAELKIFSYNYILIIIHLINVAIAIIWFFITVIILCIIIIIITTSILPTTSPPVISNHLKSSLNFSHTTSQAFSHNSFIFVSIAARQRAINHSSTESIFNLITLHSLSHIMAKRNAATLFLSDSFNENEKKKWDSSYGIFHYSALWRNFKNLPDRRSIVLVSFTIHNRLQSLNLLNF